MDPNGIRHSKRTKINERMFSPANRGVNEISMHHVRDGEDGIFGNTILMMGANSTETQFLMTNSTLVMEELGVESPLSM